MSDEKVVYAFGVFDLLHVGHVNLLNRAKSFGTKLVVGVVTDEVATWKGRRPVYSLPERLTIMANQKQVNEVVVQTEYDPTSTLKKLEKVDVLVHGDDWSNDFPGSEFMKSIGGRTERVPYFDGQSTSAVIKEIRSRTFREVGMKDLLDIKHVLDEHDVKFFLYGGVCLGAVRDHALIEWDWDIDLGVIERKTEEELVDIVNEFWAAGFQVPVADVIGLGFAIQRNVQTTIHWFDLADGWVMRDGLIRPEFGHGLFDNLIEIDFLGEKFRVPNPPEGYLEARYGSSWKKPMIESRR